MSDKYNTLLLERAAAAIDEANALMEGPLNHASFAEKDLDVHVAQVTKHIDDNNLDDLYNYSLPALENRLNYYANELAKTAQEHFHNWNLIDARDEY